MMSPYRGRFAPSPTGPLHFGSLIAALVSYLEARQAHGHWFVRIEDVDPLREPPGAADEILRTLEAHALCWDGKVRYQSAQHTLYRARLDELRDRGRLYPCACSRKALAALSGRHPAQCRTHPDWTTREPVALRFAVNDVDITWNDLCLGPQTHRLRAELDDVVLLRKEGFFAYQLAVVCDDIDQQMTHIVRGNDLLDTTAGQIALYQCLKAPVPTFMHLPLITHADGQKLSKQNHAPALDNARAAQNLVRALQHLGQCPPPELAHAPPEQVMAWALTHWQRQRLPAQRLIVERPTHT